MSERKFQETVPPQWFSLVLVLVLVLPTALAFTLNIAADPFQILSRDAPEETAFLSKRGQDRYQMPGVIRHYQPQSIIVGHSLAANFQPTRVERVLGWDSVYNLTLKGSTIYEHRRVATFALANAAIDRVMWLFFPANLRLPAVVYTPRMTFPEYLYDDSRFNDLRFFVTLPRNLADYREEKARVRAMLRELRAETGAPVDARDYATNWQLTQDNRFNAVDEIVDEILGDYAGRPGAYRKALAQSFPLLKPGDIAGLTIAADDDFHANLQTNLLAVVAANPGVDFVFIPMPPLTTLHWQHLRVSEPGTYRNYLAYLRDFTRAMAAFDNVSVHLFGLSPLADDIRLYRDHGHYHQAVNEAMLEDIAAGSGAVDEVSVNSYLSEFDRKVTGYRLHKYQPVAVPGQDQWREGALDLQAGRDLVAAIRARAARRQRAR